MIVWSDLIHLGLWGTKTNSLRFINTVNDREKINEILVRYEIFPSLMNEITRGLHSFLEPESYESSRRMANVPHWSK